MSVQTIPGQTAQMRGKRPFSGTARIILAIHVCGGILVYFLVFSIGKDRCYYDSMEVPTQKRRKALLVILLPPVLLLLGLLLLLIGSMLPQDSFARKLAILLVGVPLVTLGFFNIIPGILYGIKLYSYKPSAPPRSGMGSFRGYGAQLSLIFHRHIYPAELSWSYEQRSILLKRSDEATATIFSVDFSDIKQAKDGLTYYDLSLKDGRTYRMYASEPFPSRASRSGPVVAMDTYAARTSDAPKLLDALEACGVRIVRQHITRSIAIGALIASIIFLAIYETAILVFVIHL